MLEVKFWYQKLPAFPLRLAVCYYFEKMFHWKLFFFGLPNFI